MTEPRDEDLRDACDDMQGDMAEHQRRFGAGPTPDANRRLAADTFSELEKRWRDNPAPAAAPATPAAPPPQTFERQVQGRPYTVSRDFARDYSSEPLVPMQPTEQELVVKALRRLHKLLELEDTGPGGAPSLRTQAIAVMAHRTNPARFALELDKLLEVSNKYFGDWRREPEPKIFVGA